MHFAVTEVTPLNNYLLKLKFRNGEEKIFDLKPHLSKGIFHALKGENIFKTAKVNFDTVAWINEADIDPETLDHESILMSDLKIESKT